MYAHYNWSGQIKAFISCGKSQTLSFRKSSFKRYHFILFVYTYEASRCISSFYNEKKYLPRQLNTTIDINGANKVVADIKILTASRLKTDTSLFKPAIRSCVAGLNTNRRVFSFNTEMSHPISVLLRFICEL